MADKEIRTSIDDKCEECSEEKITYFCKECEILFCMNCVLNHNGHQFNLLGDAVANKKDELSKIADKIMKMITVYQNIKGNVKTEEHRVDIILSDLKDWFDMCVKTNKEQNQNVIRYTRKINKQLHLWKTQRACDPSTDFGFTQEIEMYVQDLKVIFSDLDRHDSDHDLEIGSDSSDHVSWVLKMSIIEHVPMEARKFMKMNHLRNMVLAENCKNGWVCERGHHEISRYSTIRAKIVVDVDIVKCKQNVYDLAMTKSSQLLVSLTCQPGKVKKLNEAGELELVYKAPLGYKTRGITVSDNDCITVCLSHPSVFHSKGKLLRFTPQGHFLDVIQYELDGRTTMFQDPKLVRNNINGDMVVLDGDRRLVLIKRNGRKRSTYVPEREKNRNIKFEDLATDPNGYILISDNVNSEILLLNQIGRFLSCFALASTSPFMVKPTGLSIGTSGKLSLLCERQNSKGLNVYLTVFKYSIEKRENQRGRHVHSPYKD